MSTTKPAELAQFQEDGKSLVLHYNLPQPTKFDLKAPIIIEFPATSWQPIANQAIGSALTLLPNPLNEITTRNYLLLELQKMGWTPAHLYIRMQYLGISTFSKQFKIADLGGWNPPESNENPGGEFQSFSIANSSPLTDQTPPITPLSHAILLNEIAEFCFNHKLFPQAYRKEDRRWEVKLIRENIAIKPCILIIEEHGVTSMPGIYGAGKTVGTFSLLPDEETEITIRTFKKSEIERSSSSSVVDSLNKESEESFKQELNKESERGSEATTNVDKLMEKKANVGFSFPLFGGTIGGGGDLSSNISNKVGTTLRETVKSVENALRNQSTKAASRREVTVNSSEKSTLTDEYEHKVVRKLKNVNMGRTLNFVFRQLNQQYLVLHHLVRVRYAFFNGYTYEEVGIEGLSELLSKYLKNEDLGKIREELIAPYRGILDFQNRKKSLFGYDAKVGGLTESNYRQSYQTRLAQQSEIASESGDNAAPTIRTYTITNPDGSTKTEVEKRGALDHILPIMRVDGVILSVQKVMMPTDSVVVDCVLGIGEGLDPYALAMQLQEQREATLKNDIQAERILLAKSIQSDTTLSAADKVKLMKEILTDCCPQTICGCKGGIEDGN